MDEKLRFIVEASNRTNPVAQAVVRNFGSMETGAKKVGDTTSHAANTVRTAMANVAAAVTKAGGVFQGLSRTAHTALSSILTPLGALTKGVSLMGGLLGGISIVGFTKAGIDMNLTVDRATAALTKMTGSAQVAQTFVEALRKEAETSAPTLEELLPIAQQLAAAYGPAGLGKVLPTIRAFGDAAVSLGASTDGMNLALLGFRQMLGKDFPQMEELNQVRENLPGLDVNGILKRAFGTADTEMLKDAGITGQMVGEALVRGMQQAFGGAQAQGAMKLPILLSNIQDTFTRAAGQITLGFLRSLEGANGAVTKLLASFQKLTESANFMGGVTVIFDALGHALEILSEQGDKFVAWLDAVFSRQGVAVLLSNILALVQTLAQVIGIDLTGAMDPANVGKFFNAIGTGITSAINGFFGVARVIEEMVKMGQTFFRDLGDSASDIATNIAISFNEMVDRVAIMLLNLTAKALYSFAETTRAVGKILDAIGSIRLPALLGGGQLFPGFSGQMMTDATNSANRAAGIAGGAAYSLGTGWDAQGRYYQRNQMAYDVQQREKLRDQQDPFRHQTFIQRVTDAFMGNGRNTNAQDTFWANFNQNRLDIAKMLFAGAGAQQPAPSFPGAPQLYGGGNAQPQVFYPRSNVPAIPSLPDYMRPGYGATDAYTSDYMRQRDAGFEYGRMYGPAATPAWPYAMPDEVPPGYTASDAYTQDYIRRRDAGSQYGQKPSDVNVNVHAMITREGMIQAAIEAYDEMVRRGIAGPGPF
jgi:tape measure domain-containing protein